MRNATICSAGCIAVALLAGACSPTAPGTTNSVGDVTLPATMAVGDTITFDGLTLKFVGVGNDSRCPVDAQCVTAGDASVQFTIDSSSAAQPPTAFDLSLRSDGIATRLGHTIALTQLEPALHANASIEQRDYRVTVEIAKAIR